MSSTKESANTGHLHPKAPNPFLVPGLKRKRKIVSSYKYMRIVRITTGRQKKPHIFFPPPSIPFPPLVFCDR